MIRNTKGVICATTEDMNTIWIFLVDQSWIQTQLWVTESLIKLETIFNSLAKWIAEFRLKKQNVDWHSFIDKYFHSLDSPDESVDETICRLKDVLQ